MSAKVETVKVQGSSRMRSSGAKSSVRVQPLLLLASVAAADAAAAAYRKAEGAGDDARGSRRAAHTLFIAYVRRQTDGQTDRQTDRTSRTEEQNRQTDRQTDRFFCGQHTDRH